MSDSTPTFNATRRNVLKSGALGLGTLGGGLALSGVSASLAAAADPLTGAPMAALATAGAADYFLSIDGIPGESVERDHRDWIEVLSYSWGASSTAGTGSGTGAGKATVSDLFTSPVIYVDPVLAPIYGLEAASEGLARHELQGERSGLLTQPALLTLLSNHNQSSPIRRGVFVRDRLLCSPVQAPPPTVDNSPPDPDPALSNPVHQIALVVNGIHLLENLKLDELAGKQVYEFALIVQPLKMQGGTGSTVAPTAVR